jgi:D-alanyl-D-alanine carboxypeptidase/D-alanyl-D-alanine-endopeptidase (penicillin-binding protein 4)
MTKLFTVFCLFGLFPVTVFAAMLPQPVIAELDQEHIPLSSVAVAVQEVNADAPLISLNSDRAVNPASTMKLLTTFAALETLGPAYRWKTEAFLNGKLENGVLQGDLVFKGYGDPKLTVEQFWMWLRELRQRGLREIRGDLVLDHSFFEEVNEDPAEFDNDPTSAYNVGTSALLLNFNVQHLHLIPNGHATTALLEPVLAGYTVHNNITASANSGCNGRDTYSARLDGRDIVLEGSIPADCGEADDYFSLLSQDEYFFAVFKGLWQELGGMLQGNLREGTAAIDQTPFATYVSPPLSEVIRDINKFSNNIMARQLFLTLGVAGTENDVAYAAQSMGGQLGGDIADEDLSSQQLAPVGVPVPANIGQSISSMQEWLENEKLHFPELVLENGTGLSRKERISALHLAELLQRATSSPFYAELEASLPILGMDGTVKKRFKDSDIAGYAHLKTGSLEGVKSMAGYVKAYSGKQWIVVFIVNHPNAARSQPAQDALIAWLQTEN